jgi:hypothetical protein
VNVSPAQSVANKVVLSMALQHLQNWRSQTLNTHTQLDWGPASS